MQTATQTRIVFSAEEELYLVYDRDGDVQDGYETLEDAEAAAAELEADYAEQAHDDAVSELQSDIQSLVDECDDLVLLTRIKAMLEG
jgi:hypothetical protein